MAVAIDTSFLALDVIPRMQSLLDHFGRDGRRFQIHKVSVCATIVPYNPGTCRRLWRGLSPIICPTSTVAKQEALDWQPDPDDDLGDAAVLHHLHEQAATVPFLSDVTSQSDWGHAATTLTGSALSASINAKTQGRPLASFHSYRISSFKLSDSVYHHNPLNSTGSIAVDMTTLFPHSAGLFLCIMQPSRFIVWASPKAVNHHVFFQLQADVIDLFSSRLPISHPQKRLRTAFNQFLQVSYSTVVEDTSRQGNPLPHVKTFNGVRHRRDRKVWVAEWKPPKHKTKPDFGNFKSEDEAAHAVDAAFYHYGRQDLLNFPHASLQFLSRRPKAPEGMDEKAKVKFVREEAKLLLEDMAASSPPHSIHINSLQELPASPRPCSADHFPSFPEISSPPRSSGPDEVDAVVSQPQPRMLLDSICDISTTGVPTNSETLNSVQSAEQGWDWTEDLSTLTAPPNVVNPSAYESQAYMWVDSFIRSSPARTYSRSPSPSHFQEEIIAHALREHQTN